MAKGLVCVCVSLGLSSDVLAQPNCPGQIWAARYPASGGLAGAADVPVGVTATASGVYAGGTRIVNGGGVFAVTKHALSDGSLFPDDFQWPLDNTGTNITAKVMREVHGIAAYPSMVNIFLTGVTPSPEGFLWPVTISVLDDVDIYMRPEWSASNGYGEEAGNDIPVAMSFGSGPTGISVVGVLTDTDGGRGRFRVYLYRINDGVQVGQVSFPMSMWSGLDDVPVGLHASSSDVWVACTHTNSSGVNSVRVYRFNHRGQQLQTPVEFHPPAGHQYSIRAASPSDLLNPGWLLLACQDESEGGARSDFLTLKVGININTGLVEVLGKAWYRHEVSPGVFNDINIPTAITPGFFRDTAETNEYIHVHVTGITQLNSATTPDILTLQYGYEDYLGGTLQFQWGHPLDTRPGRIDVPNAIAFTRISVTEPRILVTGTSETAPDSNIFRYITLVYDGRVPEPPPPGRVLVELDGPCGQETNLDIGRNIGSFYHSSVGLIGCMTGTSRHPVTHDDFVQVRFTIGLP